jgi:F-type H+-transporting ATPase subunit delta
MKVTKETRRFARELLRASYSNGALDQAKIASLVQTVIASKPRNYIRALEYYRRLLRLEVEKRHARIESASALSPATTSEIVANLKARYGGDLTTEFVVNESLIGGMRVRVGSDVWDGSVRNRLQRLAEQF